jgi:hypothetical protein
MLVENKVKDSIDGLKQVAVRVFVQVELYICIILTKIGVYVEQTSDAPVTYTVY